MSYNRREYNKFPDIMRSVHVMESQNFTTAESSKISQYLQNFSFCSNSQFLIQNKTKHKIWHVDTDLSRVGTQVLLLSF